MKKLLFSFFLFLLPCFVFALDDSIMIQSIELEGVYGNASELEAPRFDGFSIQTKVSFNQVGDYVDYKLVISNDSSDDYYYSMFQ